MDNSFPNLTLSYVAENRNLKGSKTPHQAYSGDPERYESILDRARQFIGDRSMAAAKLKRFAMDDQQLEGFLEDFRERQLNDTAYATSLAARFLGILYGGTVDADGRKRVQAVSGRATHDFRTLWKLNAILNDGPTAEGGYRAKSRDDHRHHAIDALVVGLTDAAMIKRLSDAAQRAPAEHRRRFASLEAPWHNFVDSVRAEIDKIVVSHRVSRRVSGALHKDTTYSRQEFGPNRRRRRVALTELSEKDILSDKVIPEKGPRELIRKKFESLGGGDPEKLFSDQKNLPFFSTTDGRSIPIKKIRIEETVKTRGLGQSPRERYAKPGANHHLEFFCQLGPDGDDKKWETPDIVTMLDAYERLKRSQPLVQKYLDTEWQFKFSVGQNDALTFDAGPYKGLHLIVRAISQEEKTGSVKIEMVPINDARQKDLVKKSKCWITKSPNELRKWCARKVKVDPLGEVSVAHD